MTRSFVKAAVALCMIVLFSAFAVPTQAHNNPTPTPDVGHALLWDTAWDVDSSTGRLFQVLAESDTAMASTTKSWTLHLAMEALQAGQVDLNDQVTAVSGTVLGSCWVPSGSSLMTDTNGVSLQAGETVMFADLLRGMMYPSGNDAATTIALHVAQGIWGPGASVADFVNLMTFHAWSHGYTDSWFTNPPGLDGDPCNVITGTHHTTARDQVRWWAHAYASHQLFRDIVGFTGTWSFTTTGVGTKSYSYNWGFTYPGWEGHKGGDTSQCSGPNEANNPNTNDYGCMIMSAERLGRQVVKSFMQGKWADTLPGSGQAPLFDYAFAKIFHPDIRGQGPTWGASVQDHDLACGGGGRAVSAVFRASHPLKLVVWGTDVDGSEVTKLGESVERFRGPFFKKLSDGPGDAGTLAPGGDPGPGPRPGPDLPGKGGQAKPIVRTVQVVHMGGGTYATAARVGGQVTLARWFVAADNTVSLLGTETTGPANGIALHRLQSDMLLLVMKQPSGDLKLETWGTLARQGSAFSLLDSHVETSHTFSEIGVTGIHDGVLFGSGDPRAVTVATTTANQLVYHVWSFDSSTGAITKKDTLTSATDVGAIAITDIPVRKQDGEILAPAHTATVYRQSGVTVLRFHSISSSGQITFENSATVDQDTYTGHRLVPFGPNGVLLLARDAAGVSRFFVFDLLRDAFNNVNPGRIAEHTSLAGSDFEPCRQATTHAAADVILARENTNSALVVNQYRLGDLPY